MLLSSPEAGPPAWRAHAWRNCIATLSLQPSRQLRVTIANKRICGGFLFAILTRTYLKGQGLGQKTRIAKTNLGHHIRHEVDGLESKTNQTHFLSVNK